MVFDSLTSKEQLEVLQDLAVLQGKIEPIGRSWETSSGDSIIKGYDEFEGQLIHPQQWPEDLNYENKKVIVIGSGATAVTLVPEIAKDANSVTMLQRSPTYIVAYLDFHVVYLNKNF